MGRCFEASKLKLDYEKAERATCKPTSGADRREAVEGTQPAAAELPGGPCKRPEATERLLMVIQPRFPGGTELEPRRAESRAAARSGRPVSLRPFCRALRCPSPLPPWSSALFIVKKASSLQQQGQYHGASFTEHLRSGRAHCARCMQAAHACRLRICTYVVSVRF